VIANLFGLRVPVRFRFIFRLEKLATCIEAPQINQPPFLSLINNPSYSCFHSFRCQSLPDKWQKPAQTVINGQIDDTC